MAEQRAIRKSKAPSRQIHTYWDRAQWPLQSLYFLLPILILYEIGTLWYAPPGDERLPPIWAESLLDQFFKMFGVTGYYLPGVLVVVVLLVWHMARRDPWGIEPKLYVLMWAESLVLAAPLFVFMLVLFRAPPVPVEAATSTAVPLSALLTDPANVVASFKAGLVFSIGAGIYEELLFRLIAIALVHMLLVDVIALPDVWGATGAVAVSAVAFAMYHFTGDNVFAWSKFFFYVAAGVYLAAVYVLRGFGIVAATHALYDVMVETMRYVQA